MDMRNGTEFRHLTGADIPDWQKVVAAAKDAWQAVVDRPSSKLVPRGVVAEDAWCAGLASAYRAGQAASSASAGSAIALADATPEQLEAWKRELDESLTTSNNRLRFAMPTESIVGVPFAFHFGIRHPDGQVSDYKHREAVARHDLKELRESDPSYTGELVRYAVGAPEVVQ